MIKVNIHDAKTRFSMLIKQVLNGEEVVIAKGGNPVAKLVPYSEQLPERRSNQFQGTMKIADDFDAPLSKEELDKFYNNKI